MRTWKTVASLIVLASTVSCGDVARQGRSPMYLVIDSLKGSSGNVTDEEASDVLHSDVLTAVSSPEPCSATSLCYAVFNDSGVVILRLSPKDVATPGVGNQPSTNNQVTINRYRVAYRRADGRNTPGVDVPYAWDGAVTGTVPATGTASLAFELVRHTTKREPPIVQLTRSPTTITTIADITFYGRDQVGNDISVTGSIQVDFGDFGVQ
ncbi:MAG: hypothetical protein GEU82_01925 [Luteitalea sp.]|nr:hypothetical protein [Luteitalea sp.]